MGSAVASMQWPSRDVILQTGIGVLGRWLYYVVMAIHELSGCDVSYGEPEDIWPDLGRLSGPARVSMTPALGRRHIDLIEAQTVKAILTLDDPIDCVRFTKIDKGFDTITAIREQTRIAATHELFLRCRNTVIIPRRYAGSVRDLLALLVKTLDLDLTPQTLAALLQSFGGPPEDPWTLERALEQRGTYYRRLDDLRDSTITREEAAAIRYAVSPLVLTAASSEPISVTWPAYLLAHGDRSKVPLPTIADVTAGARIIFYGSYYHLPAGRWIGQVIFTFHEGLKDTKLYLTTLSGQAPLARVMFVPIEAGTFGGTFELTHRSPETPIEIQLSSEGGNGQGRVTIEQIGFRRSP